MGWVIGSVSLWLPYTSNQLSRSLIKLSSRHQFLPPRSKRHQTRKWVRLSWVFFLLLHCHSARWRRKDISHKSNALKFTLSNSKHVLPLTGRVLHFRKEDRERGTERTREMSMTTGSRVAPELAHGAPPPAPCTASASAGPASACWCSTSWSAARPRGFAHVTRPFRPVIPVRHPTFFRAHPGVRPRRDPDPFLGLTTIRHDLMFGYDAGEITDHMDCWGYWRMTAYE